MRRAALVLLGLAACQQAAISPSAQIVGLRDMVRVGEFLFITSTERDELRVLDLVTADTAVPRRFVRAPNPIQALSIPVLRRPTVLATDVFYEKGVKNELAGPYVYATDPAVSQISIVWGEDRDPVRGYTELTRLNTVGPVTAITSRGRKPSITEPVVQPEHDTMYFATSAENAASIFRISLPQPEQLMTNQRVESLVRFVGSRMGETVVDMVALPNGTLAIATRKRGGGGSAEVIDGLTGRNLVTLQFPAPVRMIYTHPEFDFLDPGLETVEAGTRIYGVLDEAVCGSVACGGIVAVDTATGARSQSRPGQKLDGGEPLEQRIAPVLTFGSALGNGLIQSVSFGSNFPITLPSFDPSLSPDLSLLGVASLSNGRIAFFRAAELRPIVNSSGPYAEVSTPDGGFYLSGDADGGTFVGPTVIAPNGTFPYDQTFVVQAGADPAAGYVVSGGFLGDIGRTGPGQTFTWPGGYFFHPAGYDPAAPALTIRMPPEPLGPGERYEIRVVSNYVPTDMTLSQTICPAGFTSQPGAVVVDPERRIIFVGYPSANAVIEIPAAAVRKATLLEGNGLLCWR